MSSLLGSGGRSGPFPSGGGYGRPTEDKAVARERLEADMETFDKAGGKVELLGITPLRRKPKKDALRLKGSTKAEPVRGQE